MVATEQQRDYAGELVDAICYGPSLPVGLAGELFRNATFENTTKGLRITFDARFRPLMEGRQKTIGGYIHKVLGMVTISFHYYEWDKATAAEPRGDV